MTTKEISSHKIYVITKGCYSDYGICAVTTDKAKAEELRLFFSDKYDDANIEEYEDGQTGLSDKSLNVVHPFVVTGQRRNLEQNKDLISSVRQYTKILYPGEMFETEMSYRIADDRSDWLDLFVLAPDAEHAKKIWYDTWAKLNAEILGL